MVIGFLKQLFYKPCILGFRFGLCYSDIEEPMVIGGVKVNQRIGEKPAPSKVNF